MASLKETLARANDSEESLITQFETTLTIHGTANDDPPDNDISIDHTVLSNYNQSSVNLTELEEEEVALEQIPKFKTKRRYSLQPQHASRHRTQPGRQSKSPSPDDYYRTIDPKFADILKPSPLIDIGLTKFHRSLTEFIKMNPHVESDSPRFFKETDKTLVILLPYSAEHAFGRKWVTKSYLATIFERPQRLLALCIGVAAALTMYPYFYSVINATKRGLVLLPHVLKVHGKNWPKKLFELCLDSHDKLRANKIEVPEDWNTGDIYLTPRTINAIEGVVGTLETAVDKLFAEKHDLAFVVIRPPGHHSHACLPLGFCLLNNVQIAIEYAFDTYRVTHCAILDIDLHHGDGLQDICWERAGFMGDYGQDPDEDEGDHLKDHPRDEYGKRYARYPKVGYFSLHDIKLYPTEHGYATKENIKNALTCIMDHDLNIWNVHLQEWKLEEEFYKHYQTKYVAILNRANQFLNQAKKQYENEYLEYLVQLAKYNKYLLKQKPIAKPVAPPPFKPLIMISAGFDASEYENPMMQRHGINVPTSFYATFTKDVVKLAKIHTGGKVISFLEGGYSDGALTTGIFSHLIGLNHADDSDGSLWNETWGTPDVMKELTRGCKKTWTPYKKPTTDMTVWANEVIKLGRAMMPNAVLPQGYVYDYDKGKDEKRPALSKMVRDLGIPGLEETRGRYTRSGFIDRK